MKNEEMLDSDVSEHSLPGAEQQQMQTDMLSLHDEHENESNSCCRSSSSDEEEEEFEEEPIR